MKLKNLILGIAAFVAVGLQTGIASADYLCQVNNPTINSSASGFGNAGGMYFNTYTGKDCTGSLIRHYYVCSPGTTFGQCTKNTNVLYDRDTILSLFSAMRTAQMDDQRVSITIAQCNDNTTTCFGGISFMAQ